MPTWDLALAHGITSTKLSRAEKSMVFVLRHASLDSIEKKHYTELMRAVGLVVEGDACAGLFSYCRYLMCHLIYTNFQRQGAVTNMTAAEVRNAKKKR